MAARAYSGIIVSSYINVSSSGHYTGRVFYGHHGKREAHDVALESLDVFGRGLNVKRLPRYVMDEIRSQLLVILEGTEVTFYEYNQDHDKRFTDLRYHDPRAVAWIVECLKRDNA